MDAYRRVACELVGELEGAFPNRVVRGVSFSASRSKRTASNFRALALGDVDVGIVGGVRRSVGGRRTDPVDAAGEREFAAVSEREIPAMSLARESRGDHELGRDVRVR